MQNMSILLFKKELKNNGEIMRYVNLVTRSHYKQNDRKKMSMDVFRKEISGAYTYGQMEMAIELINRSSDLTRDEIIGELQLIVKDSYHKCKKEFGLIKCPTLELEDIVYET